MERSDRTCWDKTSVESMKEAMIRPEWVKHEGERADTVVWDTLDEAVPITIVVELDEKG